jgi:ABC-type sulfate transport system permease component
VRYEIAVVSSSSKKTAAQAWIKTLLSARGQAALKEYGFLPVPARVAGGALFRTTLVLATSVVPPLSAAPHRRGLPPDPAGELVSALGSDAARDAARVTAETISISMVVILVFGTPAAYWISTRRGALRDVLVTLVELPLVLPPAVAGIGLLVAFGRSGSSAAPSTRSASTSHSRKPRSSSR